MKTTCGIQRFLNSYTTTIIFLPLCLCQASVLGQSQPDSISVVPQALSYVDSAAIHNEIVELIDHITEIEPDFDQRTIDYLAHCYHITGFEPVWQTARYAEALLLLRDSQYEGLRPSDYYVEKIDSLRMHYDETDPSVNHIRVEMDVLTTYAFLKYGEHLMEGKLNPTEIFQEWNYTRRIYSVEVVDALMKSIEFEDPQAYLQFCRPKSPTYAHLKSWLRKLIDDHPFDAGLQLPEGVGALREGDSTGFVLDLKVYLSQFSDRNDFHMDAIFDSTLLKTIKRFQSHHGLEPDGVLGKQTVAKLNISNEDWIELISINLERCRWILHDLPERYLLVNVAGYKLYLYDQHEQVYSSRVIVGEPHHATPVFHADIEFVEFNCTWTVPSSIARWETLPSVQQDEDYLETRHFEVLNDGGEIIAHDTINFAQYGPRNLPYTFRQQPGPWNALGQIKFIFPNKYNVYLHDTPARKLFTKEATRAFSHGCVRVQHPKKLAEKILGPQGYTTGKVDRILDSSETTREFLEKPLPLLLTYWTVYTENDGKEIFFVSDIYGRDKRIARLMAL